MEVPNWVWDELRFRTTGSTGLLIALAIFRHGGGRNAEAFPREGIEHRARVRTTLNSLAKMAGVAIRSAEEAVKELKGLGMLDVSTPDAKDRVRSFSMPYALPAPADSAEGGAAEELAPANVADELAAAHAEPADSAGGAGSSRARANGGGGGVSLPSSQPLVHEDPITTTTGHEVPRAQILRALRALGVSSVPGILNEFGIENVYGALRVVHDEMSGVVVANPAGLLVATLKAWRVFEVPEDATFLEDLTEPGRLRDRLRDKKWESPYERLNLRS